MAVTKLGPLLSPTNGYGVDILYKSVLICFQLFAFQIGPPKPWSMSIYKNDISNLFIFFLHTIGYELRLRLDYDNSQCPLIGTTLMSRPTQSTTKNTLSQTKNIYMVQQLHKTTLVTPLCTMTYFELFRPRVSKFKIKMIRMFSPYII